MFIRLLRSLASTVLLTWLLTAPVWPAAAPRIVPAGPPAAMDLYIVAPEALVGWPGPWPAATLALMPPPYRELPVVGRLTGRNPTLDAAGLNALAPDLVVDSGDVTPAYAALASRIQEDSGIRTVLLDGSLAQAPTLIRQLGEMTGSSRSDALEAYAGRVLAALPQTHGSGPLVYFGRGADGLAPVRPATLHGEVLDMAGARNVVPAGQGRDPVTPARIAAWKPDFILLSDREACTAVQQDPAWSAVRAVARGGILCDPLLPFGWVDHPPALNRLLGVQWLAAALHPEAAPLDLKAALREFSALAYGIALTEAQLDAILGLTRPPG